MSTQGDRRTGSALRIGRTVGTGAVKVDAQNARTRCTKGTQSETGRAIIFLVTQEKKKEKKRDIRKAANTYAVLKRVHYAFQYCGLL